ncbi:hypothetical protein ACLIYM_02985 [Streptomyces fenghuangensis]|uniref:hypothetical protein n=1 Tax=Streptomyces sp. ICN903 TaxID=2964654 RepID=UPI001EDB56AC|nr:hypothetical protein [Streptomyces sp. ICN903]MCG3041512.1 hypothetical protein [Streptomyces sp. ICN903]
MTAPAILASLPPSRFDDELSPGLFGLFVLVLLLICLRRGVRAAREGRAFTLVFWAVVAAAAATAGAYAYELL